MGNGIIEMGKMIIAMGKLPTYLGQFQYALRCAARNALGEV